MKQVRPQIMCFALFKTGGALSRTPLSKETPAGSTSAAFGNSRPAPLLPLLEAAGQAGHSVKYPWNFSAISSFVLQAFNAGRRPSVWKISIILLKNSTWESGFSIAIINIISVSTGTSGIPIWQNETGFFKTPIAIA